MSNNKVLLKIGISLAGLAGGALVALIAFFIINSWWSSPPSLFGFSVLGLGDSVEQPIAFPHTVHVQDVGLDCQFCHRTASTSEAAGIPAVQQCMFCHTVITGDGSPEIAKLVDAFASGEPIDWVRVHRLPDHVQFLHEPHIQAGFSCSTCHGDVGSMVEVQQVRNLKMRDCVDCHRSLNAPTDCSTCHY